MTATLVAALIERLIAEGAPDDLLAPITIVLALVTAFTQALLTYVITVMAERLSFASKAIGVLRR